MFARAQSMLRAVFVVGGLACGYIADRFGLTVPWLVAASIFAVAFVVGLGWMYDDRPVRRSVARGPSPSLAQTVLGGLGAVRDHPVLRMLWVLSLLSALAMMPVVMLWPPHVEALGGGGYRVLGWAWAALNVAATFGALAVPALLRRMNREWLLFGLALWRAVFLAAAALGGSLAGVLGLLVLYEMAVAARQPVVLAWANEHVGSTLRSTVLSVQGMAFTLGGSLGLTLFGLVARAYGIPAVWLGCALVFAAATGD